MVIVSFGIVLEPGTCVFIGHLKILRSLVYDHIHVSSIEFIVLIKPGNGTISWRIFFFFQVIIWL